MSKNSTGLRVMTWNVHGGGKAAQIAEVVEALSPDVFVIIGCSAGKAAALSRALVDAGLSFVEAASPSMGFCTFLHSRLRLRRLPADRCPNPGLWVAATLPDHDLAVAGAYVPLKSKLEPTRKTDFWKWLLEESDELIHRPTIILGDLNTGDQVRDRTGGTKFNDEQAFREMSRRGWRDAYLEVNPRQQAFSWWSRVNGFRIDHAFLSPGAPSVIAATYMDRIGDMTLANPHRNASLIPISDHAALVVDLAAVSSV